MRAAALDVRLRAKDTRGSAREVRARAARARAAASDSLSHSFTEYQRARALQEAWRAISAAPPRARLVRQAPSASAPADTGRVERRVRWVRHAAASGMEPVRVDWRCVRDPYGVMWGVWELDARRVPGSRGPRCLVFDCAAVVRRVWRYPECWEQLSDEALAELLRRAD